MFDQNHINELVKSSIENDVNIIYKIKVDPLKFIKYKQITLFSHLIELKTRLKRWNIDAEYFIFHPLLLNKIILYTGLIEEKRTSRSEDQLPAYTLWGARLHSSIYMPNDMIICCNVSGRNKIRGLAAAIIDINYLEKIDKLKEFI